MSPVSWPDRVFALSINAARDAELVTVCGRDMSRAEAFARRHGASAAYESVNEMLNDMWVSAVYISLHSTPPSSLYPVGCRGKETCSGRESGGAHRQVRRRDGTYLQRPRRQAGRGVRVGSQPWMSRSPVHDW